MATGTFVLGTRASALALRQARHIKARLEEIGYIVDLKEITTTGDRILDVPLSKVGDKGLFTKELDLALLDGRIHLAVHSLKDLPTQMPPGIRLAAVTEREDPRDAFVAHPRWSGTLADLPPGATVATSSLRRTAQLKAWRTDIEVVSVRGNVDTRLNKLDAGDWHGLLLASAGLQRLGLHARVRELIHTDIMLPAVGQGALGIVCVEEDSSVSAMLREALHDPAIGFGTAAERAFLRKLEGGCSVPVGAYGRVNDADELELEGCVASLDGMDLVRGAIRGAKAEAELLGLTLAERLLEEGAGEILAKIRAAQQ